MAANSRKRRPARPVVDEPQKEQIEHYLAASCEAYGVPINLARAICQVESSFTDPSEVGAAGEIGPMQVTPPAMADMDSYIALNSSLESKVDLGVRWLSLLIRAAHAKLRPGFGRAFEPTRSVYALAVRAYNAGFRGAAELGRGADYLNRVKQTGLVPWL